MPIEVIVYQIRDHHRSRVVCDAMVSGIRKMGDRPVVVNEAKYRGPVGDVALFYGMVGNLPKILKEYPASGKTAIYVDLGYFGRREGGRWTGYHKVVANSRHPTDYFQRKRHNSDRAVILGVMPKPWKTGQNILLAGMSDRGARDEGFLPEKWERSIISRIRKHSDRPIIYRPKPSWKLARPIEGTIFSPSTEKLADVLEDCHAIVTHHSNVAIDGIVEGIPSFCWLGIGSVMASQDISLIEAPPIYEGRDQFLADACYTQYSIEEMKTGVAWAYLKVEGLVP